MPSPQLDGRDVREVLGRGRWESPPTTPPALRPSPQGNSIDENGPSAWSSEKCFPFGFARRHGELLEQLANDYNKYLSQWSDNLDAVGPVLPSSVEPASEQKSSAAILSNGMKMELWPVWEEDAESKRHGKLAHCALRTVVHWHAVGSKMVGGEHTSPFSWLVIRPTSWKANMWENLTLMTILYDVFTVPLAAFDYQTLLASEILEWITTIFWTVDLVVRFFMGFLRGDGVIEARLLMIARHYFKGWFGIEFAIVAVDWSAHIIDASGTHTAGGIARASRLGRSITRFSRIVFFVRTLRVIRCVRLATLCRSVVSWSTLHYAQSLIDICKLIGVVAALNHFIACTWYWLGTQQSGPSWVRQFENEKYDMFYRYILSVNWSIAQFTPYPINIHPVTKSERIFAFAILCIGLVIFSSLLGSAAAIINQTRKVAQERFEQAYKLNAFLRDNHVSVQSAMLIKKFLQDRAAKKDRILESDVPALEALPKTMQEMLHFELYQPTIAQHSCFARLEDQSIAHFCNNAVTMVALVKGDELTIFRRKGTSMIFVISGSLEYFYGPDAAHSNVTEAVLITGNDQVQPWLTEAPLWCNWHHQGLLLVFETPCDVIRIDSFKFRKAIAGNFDSWFICAEYAKKYLEAMSIASNRGVVIDDLWGTPCSLTDSEPPVLD